MTPAARRPKVRRGYLPAESEAAFQQKVLQLARYLGWMDYHTFDSRRSARGFPDLVLVRGTELIFAELKTDKGAIRPEQQTWLDALEHVGAAIDRQSNAPLEQGRHVQAYLWRPADFADIERVLALPSRNRPTSEVNVTDPATQAGPLGKENR